MEELKKVAIEKEKKDILSMNQSISLQANQLTEASIEPIKERINRISSGIPGFDEIIDGGFIPNSINLISGETGTGKTIFCSQFIWNALCIGENGVYITTQQIPDEVRDDVAIFGRDFKKAEEMNQCRILYIKPQDMKKIVDIILKNVKAINAKRLVIDSITIICEYAEKRKDMRLNLSHLFQELKKMGVTTLITSEIEEGSKTLSRFGIEEFMVDSVTVLNCGVKVGLGGVPRSLYIKKMRRTSHDLNIHPFKISEKGVTLIS